MELARQLNVARGTVQSRLDKLQASGVVTGFGPDLDLGAIGYDVTAFVTIEVAQGRLEAITGHLARIPEVLEVHTTTGPADLHCRVVAHTNEHLAAVLDRMLDVAGILRTATQIALTEQIRLRTFPLIDQLVDDDA
jgi:DNA-binding Lrp family transcriptional regulator